MFDRRQFLVGLFGSAAIVAAGPIPAALSAIPEPDFKKLANDAYLAALREIYGNGKDYGFAKVEYLPQAPWFKLTPPDGFSPLRAESDRISAEAIAMIKKEMQP